MLTDIQTDHQGQHMAPGDPPLKQWAEGRSPLNGANAAHGDTPQPHSTGLPIVQPAPFRGGLGSAFNLTDHSLARRCTMLMRTLFCGIAITTAAQAQTPTPNPIQIENAKPGTRGWYVTKPAMNGEIQAYAGEDSINKGEDAHLYVSSQRPYTMQLYRLGYYGGAGARLL